MPSDGADQSRAGNHRASGGTQAPSQVSIRGLAAAVSAWHRREFVGSTLAQQALVLAEESGEVARCVVKAEQGIRGGAEHWAEELRKEAADVLIALCAVADQGGFDLAEAVAERWETIRHREFNEDSKSGLDPCECGSERREHRYGTYGCRQDKTALPNPCSGFRKADPATVATNG